MDLCIIFSSGEESIPEYLDEVLFLHFKKTMIEKIENAEIIFFGYAPDNTADGNDDVLTEGVFFRIIASSEILKLDVDSEKLEIKKSFKNVLETQKPKFGNVIIEKGFINTEKTIEFIF